MGSSYVHCMVFIFEKHLSFCVLDVSWVLANIMTEYSWYFRKCNREIQHRDSVQWASGSEFCTSLV